MNRIFTLTLFCSLAFFGAKAQEYAQISVGPSYTNHAFYTLGDDNVVSLANESWDLAFTTGGFDAGIHYNESAMLSFTGEAPVLRLYRAPSDEFTDVIETGMLTDSLYNSEESWEVGAFNSVAIPGDPFDYGWGAYNTSSHVVEGNKVFALKLRDDSWVKIKIESMTGGVYTMKYADLDGANETTVTIDKAEFSDSPLVFFSFATGNATASPAGWDLLFARYLSELDAGGGEIVQYAVTGTLSGPGVEIAQANNVDVLDVEFADYQDSLDTELDVIGHEWKYFDLDNFSWQIIQDEAYFVKLADNHLWKVLFIDFEGSSTGTSTIEKTDLGVISFVNDPNSNFDAFEVFPNPVVDNFTVSFTLKHSRSVLPVQIFDATGKIVWQSSMRGNEGLNVLNINRPSSIPSGIYQLVVGQGNDHLTKTILIK